jgi:hypothetical protein
MYLLYVPSCGSTAFIGKVGKDDFGDFFASHHGKRPYPNTRTVAKLVVAATLVATKAARGGQGMPHTTDHSY